MKKIIITADDYGMCSEVDEAIEDLYQYGTLTSTNVICNMNSFDDVIALRHHCPNLSIGLHWNVTAGRPLSTPERIPTLINTSGEFHNFKEFKKRFNGGLINEDELEIELSEQYNRFFTLLGKPDYWNTHQNSSLCLKAYQTYRRVALKYGILATRTFRRVYMEGDRIVGKQWLREQLVRNFFDMWFKLDVSKSFLTPSARLTLFNLASKFDIAKLNASLSKSQEESIEIVIHPSTTANNKYFGSISELRVEEYRFFKEPTIKAMLTNGDYKLIGYAESDLI